LFCGTALLLIPEYVDTVGDKRISNIGRIVTIRHVVEAVTPLSIVTGHGFGIGTVDKPVHMEISYLEIFHKQGILGLSFWFIFFLAIMQLYFKASRNGKRYIALPFMLSCLFAFAVTATNPYINNPIGMSILLISIAVLSVLARKKHVDLCQEESKHESISYL